MKRGIPEGQPEPARQHRQTEPLNSLLGLAVVPWERLETNILDVDIETLDGWPRVQELENTYSGGTKSLKFLVNRLRNAVAHGGFRFEGSEPSFSPDSREPSEVKVVMTDYRIEHGVKRTWQAEINGEDLYRFCDKFIEHVKDKVGSVIPSSLFGGVQV